MEPQAWINLVSNNGLAIVLLVWFLYKADKYISVFLPRVDQIYDAITRQTVAFMRLSEEIKKWNKD